MRTKCLVVSFVCLASLTWAQGYYSIEPATLKPSAPISAELRKTLDTRGTRLVTSPDGEKNTLCELWFSKVVSAYPQATGPQEASYSNLKKGTLLGVIHFPAKTKDARGQELAPGYYTMRYVQMPQDNSHETVMEYPDFVALSPVAADTKSYETMPLDALLDLSRRASGKSHPAVIGLMPANPGYTDFPGLVPGQAVLQVKIKTKVGTKAPEELKLAIILVPIKAQDTGS
ncbi:MAG: hypothetical protein JWQ87_1694 [Candidatus Sulfotelmatobacter sp.]|nr:hypothetical protein [Candidatus Sulfotelmatobacter sp.]